jgi:hypothetical protein
VIDKEISVTILSEMPGTLGKHSSVKLELLDNMDKYSVLYINVIFMLDTATMTGNATPYPFSLPLMSKF